MGTMTRNRIVKIPAPSITAASSISRGIPERKLLHINVAMAILKAEMVRIRDSGLLIRCISRSIIKIGTMTIWEGSRIPRVTILLTCTDSFHCIRVSA